MDPDRVSVLYDIKRKLRKGHSEDIFKQFLTLGGHSALAAIITFAIHIAMARLLGEANYASYATYVAIMFSVFFMLSSIHLIITRFVSYHRSRFQYEQINYIITVALRWMFLAGIVVFILILPFADNISGFFGLQGIANTVMLGFVLWFTMMVPAFEGAFKGLGEFHALGRMRVTEAVFRLVIVLALVLLGFGVAGALFGLGLGTLGALLVSYKKLRKIQKLKMVKPNLSSIRRFMVPVLICMISISILLNLDLILVKHFFPASEAGIFAAASLLAKVPFLVAMVFVSVMFPKVTQLHADGKATSGVLLHALHVVTPLAAVFTLAAFFFSEQLLTLIFGPGYAIGAVLGFYAFGMGALSLSVLLTTYLLAIRRDSISLFLPLFVIVYGALLAWLHTSITQIIIAVMLVNTALLAYIVYAAREQLDFDYFI